MLSWLLQPDPKLRATVGEIRRHWWMTQRVDTKQYKFQDMLRNCGLYLFLHNLLFYMLFLQIELKSTRHSMLLIFITALKMCPRVEIWLVRQQWTQQLANKNPALFLPVSFIFYLIFCIWFKIFCSRSFIFTCPLIVKF